MNLPTLPTDSLYKWMSIFGLTVLIFSGYTFISKLWEYRDKIAVHQEELEFLHAITELGAVIGILVAFWGFIQWYFKHQRYIDKELKARALEQEYKTEITRLQLERLNNSESST